MPSPPISLRLLLAAFIAAFFPLVATAKNTEYKVTVYPASGDYVVCLHGFSVSNRSLLTLAGRINAAGFESIDVAYPSKLVTPESVIADYLRPAVKKHCTDPARKIHFVGYSMGAVFTHRFLEETPPKNLGRVIFLAGPHRGISVVDFAKGKIPRIFKGFGPAANRMGTREDDFPQTLGTADFSPGVIMGRRSAFPFFSPFIPGPDDGIVPVDGGKIPGAADFITVGANHINMHESKPAAELVIQFLVNGRFDHSKDYRVTRPRAKIASLKHPHL